MSTTKPRSDTQSMALPTIGERARQRIAAYKEEIATIRASIAEQEFLLFGWGFEDVPDVEIRQRVSDDIHHDHGPGKWLNLNVKTRQEAIDLLDRMRPYAIPLTLIAKRDEYSHPVVPADCLPQDTGIYTGWHGVWWFLKANAEWSRHPHVELHCWLKKGNNRLHIVVHIRDPWDQTEEGADFAPFCPAGCESAESSVYHFAYVSSKRERAKASAGGKVGRIR